jgi:hypothetical protein
MGRVTYSFSVSLDDRLGVGEYAWELKRAD